MLNKTVGIVQTLTMLTIQFVKYIPSFHKVLIAGMMFLDLTWDTMSNEDKNKSIELLNDARLTMTCRAHAAAFILLGKRNMRKEALYLAFASSDSEETDAIAKPLLDSG